MLLLKGKENPNPLKCTIFPQKEDHSSFHWERYGAEPQPRAAWR